MKYRGMMFISDTDAHTGNWQKIVMIEATNFATLTCKDLTGDTITGESFPANHELIGNFTEIKLTSGACCAYR